MMRGTVLNGRTTRGHFQAAEDAARAYDAGARRLRGEAAHGARQGTSTTRVNFPTAEEERRREHSATVPAPPVQAPAASGAPVQAARNPALLGLLELPADAAPGVVRAALNEVAAAPLRRL
jgi:hypothetical protein